MIGIEAIEAYNGWAIALIGASIVFIGLVLLSFAVSRLHKLLDFWERRYRSNGQASSSDAGSNADSPTLPPEIAGTVQQLRLLTERLGDPFPLPKMCALAQKTGILHPYSAVNHAITAGIMIPDGSGYFTWKTTST